MWRGAFVLTTVFLAISLVMQWAVAGILATALLILITMAYIMENNLINVPELNVAVVYDRNRQAFSRLLPSGQHWLKPFGEKIEAFIPLGTESTEASCQAYTQGGVPLNVRWTASYTINPMALSRDIQSKLARKLATKSKLIVQTDVTNSLQHVFSNYTIQQLFDQGGRGRLERTVRQAATEELANAGIVLKKVMIPEVQMPADVQSTLTAAHEREVQTECEAQALSRLQKVISQFSESDMQRLAELERLRVLGQNGVSLIYNMGIAHSMPAQPSPSTTSHPQSTPIIRLRNHPKPTNLTVN